MVLYIAIILLLILAFAFAGRAFANASPETLKTGKHILIVFAGLGLLILALRIGQTQVASAIGIFMLLAPLFQRLRHWMKQDDAAPPTPPNAPQMTVTEAAAILNIPETATASEIRAAHKTLIRKNHPDQGGSDYLAGKINQARDLMLKAKKK